MSSPGAYQNSNAVRPLGGGKTEHKLALKMVALITLYAGALVAPVQIANANDVQTISCTSTPTSGSVVMAFNGEMFTMAYGATAAQWKAALEALRQIGSGNVAVTGGPLGTDLVVTFQGACAYQPQPLMTVYSSSLDAGTTTVAHTTTGVANGKYDAVANVLITDPAAGPSVSSAGTGTWAADTVKVQMAWGNDAGMTKLSPVSMVTNDGSHAIRVAAINAANTPDGAKYLYIFVDGVHAKTISVTTPGVAGNVAQTDIADASGGTGIPVPYRNATCPNIAILEYDVKTDNKGRCTFGQVGGFSFPNGEVTAPAWAGGRFKRGDLLGVSTEILEFLNARTVNGTVGSDSSEVLIPA